MHDRELYCQILGIQAPWEVAEVEVDLPGTGVTVRIRHSGERLACPQCGVNCPGHDTRERKWRHLDTCQYKTWLAAEVPRVTWDHSSNRKRLQEAPSRRQRRAH